MFPQRQHQFLIRSNLNFKINQNLISQIGFTNFLQTLPHDPYSENSFNRLELRPQFGLRYKQAIDDNISLTHWYWNEFRFIENESSFYFRNFRFRYQLTLKYNLSKKIALKAFDEIFLNFGRKIINNTFDQKRYGFGIDYKFNKYFRFDLLYFNWFQQRSSGNIYFNRDIFRITLNNTF